MKQGLVKDHGRSKKLLVQIIDDDYAIDCDESWVIVNSCVSESINYHTDTQRAILNLAGVDKAFATDGGPRDHPPLIPVSIYSQA